MGMVLAACRWRNTSAPLRRRLAMGDKESRASAWSQICSFGNSDEQKERRQKKTYYGSLRTGSGQAYAKWSRLPQLKQPPSYLGVSRPGALSPMLAPRLK